MAVGFLWFRSAAPRVLTDAAQVRGLSVAACRRGYDVRIRGTVLYRSDDFYILGDGTGAVRVEPPGELVLQKPGVDRYEVRGTTDSDGVAPLIRHPEYIPLANAPDAL